MSDHYLSTPTGPHGTLRARHPPLRDQSPSPSRRQPTPDDLLSKLTPGSVLEALQSPTGPLKACLDRASTMEQAFALKTASVSKTIHDWLEELSGWSWPSAGTSNGFETPSAKRRRMFKPEMPRDSHDTTPCADVEYFGSLPADHVIQYEKRIDQIQQDMEGLNLEEIKTQVLHKHIVSLSPPGTPLSDSGRSAASSFSYSKMEDLTAVVTIIIVQTLPALSKLSRLLNIWRLRLIVLRKVPSLLMMIADAEVALRSGWGAIETLSSNSPDPKSRTKGVRSSTGPITLKDFDVMKMVLQQKIVGPGRELDFMLDTLEGMMDTLPDEWLDRMELVERDYAKWVTAAEQKVKERECAESSIPDHPDQHVDQRLPTNLTNSDHKPLDASQHATESGTAAEDASQNPRNCVLPEVNVTEDFEPSVLEAVNEEDEEPELPPMYPRTRKGSGSSFVSTVIHGSSHSSSDYYEHGSFDERAASVQPELPRSPDSYGLFPSDVPSPPSSPHVKYQQKSMLKDYSPKATSSEASSSPPRGLLGPPVVFEPDSPCEYDSHHDSPTHMSPNSATGDDDYLQKQLRELLETIPAKIELKKRTINLNPPDFQHPSRPRHRLSDASRRPTPILSSRADSRVTTPSYSPSGTPSFMLAPVRDSRPRSMSSQGIRLYHLSRSGETPIKLFIRCVGENNERVMVRVGGGWSDLGEYLRDYAYHHGSRSKGEGTVTVTDAVPIAIKRSGSSCNSRPSSSQGSPMTPLSMQRSKTNAGEHPRTPLSTGLDNANTPASEASTSARSHGSSRIDWDEEDVSLGLAGPKTTKRRDISAESRAWIESVKAKVRLASSERISKAISSEQLRAPQSSQIRGPKKTPDDSFGDMGKAGATKRLFRKN
ncbi:hypothetical protein GGS21DRAFT_119021 [Xylaria nigripes]|nr:hypothetical protein GGS21DRAFT_119021 [Xylaria nigripes]